MSYDEDPPTRRLPVPPRDQPPRERERVRPTDPDGLGTGPPPPGPPVHGVSDAQFFDLEQRLHSMRSWLVALAAIAVVALAVAAVALISSSDDDDSTARTPSGLRNSVERLEERVEDRATKGQLSNVREEIEELKTSVAEASSAAAESGDTTTTTESADVSGLENELSDLSARIEALEQAPAAEGTATEGETP